MFECRKKRGGKKGQITLFILIGLVILAIAGFAIYLASQTRISAEEITEEVPSEFVPVQQYVEQCLYDTSKEAFVLLGQSSGYINPGQYFTKGFYETESDALEFMPGSDILIPYWWYFESSNSCSQGCSFSSNKPFLTKAEGEPSIEGMTELYIKERINECLGNFEGMEQFEITKDNDMDVETTIAESDVKVNLHYTINVKSSNSEGQLKSFTARLPLNFRRIYNMAEDITTAEQELNFLDYHAVTLIDLFSSIDSDMLPPMEGSTFEMSAPVYWTESDVKEKITEMLTSYIPGMQVLGSKNYNYEKLEQIEDPMVRGIYRNMIVPLENDYPKVNAGFEYLPAWQIYLHVTPASGGLLGPESAFGGILPIGIHHYRFAYDLSYPVLATLKDDEAFYGEGYTFMFAIESNIRNNDIINVSETAMESFNPDSGASMACDYDKRNSGYISINAVDSMNGNPVKDASVFFILGPEGCLIDSTDDNGLLYSKFPVGIGVIKVQHPDYYSHYEPFGASYDEGDSLEVSLEPYITLNVSAKTKKMEKLGRNNWQYQGDTRELDLNEKAIIILERIPDDQYHDEYSVPVEVGYGEKQEIRLLPGIYNVNGQVILDEQIKIPEDKREKCTGPFGIFCTEYTINEQIMDQSVSGTLALTNETGQWTIVSSDIENSENIVFYLLSFSIKDLPEGQREIEDISQSSNSEEFSLQNRESLEPYFY